MEEAMLDPKSTAPFYPNMINEEDQLLFKKSWMWPVVLTFNHEVGLYVSRILARDINNVPKSFDMIDHQGFNGVQVVQYQDGEETKIKVYVKSNADYDTEPYLLFDTNNIRYALSRIKKNMQESSITNEDGSSLQWVKARGWLTISKIVHNLFYNYIDSQTEFHSLHHKYMWTSNSGTIEYTTKLTMGAITKEDIPTEVKGRIEAVYQDYLENMERQQRYLEQTERIFGREKWLVGFPGEGQQVLVGSINTSKMISELKKCMDTGQDYNFSGMTTEYLMRRYKSIDHVSSDIKDSLQATMTFNKYAIGANPKILYKDTKSIIPVLEYSWNMYVPFYEINACVFKRTSSRAYSWYVFDRK